MLIGGRRSPSYQCITGPDGKQELDFISCAHCQTQIPIGVKAGLDETGWLCAPCGSYVCARCRKKGTCDVIDKKLARMEASYHARRSYASG